MAAGTIISNFTWNPSGPTVTGNDPFFSSSNPSTPSTYTNNANGNGGSLNLILINSSGTASGGSSPIYNTNSTWTLTGTFLVNSTGTGSNVLGGSWAGLNNFQAVGPAGTGNLVVSVTVTPPAGAGAVNNMFFGVYNSDGFWPNTPLATYNSTTTPPFSNTSALEASTSTYKVTVTFAITSTTSYTIPSTQVQPTLLQQP